MFGISGVSARMFLLFGVFLWACSMSSVRRALCKGVVLFVCLVMTRCVKVSCQLVRGEFMYKSV